MGKIIRRLLGTLLSKVNILLYFFRRDLISFSHSQVTLCVFRIAKNNYVSVVKAKLHKVRINIEGELGQIDLKANVRNSTIIMSGENNRLIIEEGCGIHHASFVIRGKNCTMHIQKDVSINGGEFVLMGVNNSLTIGEGSMIAANANLWATDSHPIYNEQHDIINPSLPIHIGNHVWLGKNVSVLKGVTIGEYSIVGMNSLVVKDIPPHTINVGNPSHPIKSVHSWEKKFITI